MPTTPKITVMVSIYQSGEWIENRLQNLLKHNNQELLDIWCVNANSPDPRDHEIPEKYQNLYPFKYVKLDKRISVYETWNYIINNSNSEYITNANTDDIISPDCYTKLVNHLNNGQDFAYCSWYTTHIPNQQWETLRDVDTNGHPGTYAGDINRAGVGHFPMWRRSLHDQLGLFDTQFQALADADWWARCFHVGKAKFHWHREHLGTYLWRNGENLWNKKITEAEWKCYYQKLAQYQKSA